MGVTRRRFLAGAGAVGATLVGGGAVAGTQTRPGRRLLHAVGVLDNDDLAIPAATVSVEAGTLPSGRRYRIARTGVAGGVGASGASAGATRASGSPSTGSGWPPSPRQPGST